MDDAATFGDWLRQQRRARDITIEELADRVGCYPDYVRAIEKNRRRPSRQMAEVLAGFFDVPAEQRPALILFARGRPEPPSVPALIMAGVGQVAPAARPRFNNLPAQRNAFVGREKDVEGARDLLLREGVRLVTFVGPPGIGKTRLSQRVASGLLDRFEGGVCFVPLAAIVDPDLVPAAIAHSLGLRETGDLPMAEGLYEYLQDREMLLLLDNFEQVSEAALFVSHLLDAAPLVKVLVTSRNALDLYGEFEYPVLPLELPDPRQTYAVGDLARYEAIDLFMRRATAIRPSFSLTGANAPAIAAVCNRLEGLPLAIELAAARVKLLSPEMILDRLGKRLDLLTIGPIDFSPRQQTLRGAIAWSYDLLDESEKTVFRRMSVFVGGCPVEGMEAVCAERDNQSAACDLDDVASLMDKSLVRRTDTTEPELRFTMLETIREYALEKLQESGEAEDMSRRHSSFFLGLAEFAEPMLQGPEQAAWIVRLDGDLDNIRAAVDWSLANNQEGAARLVAAIRRFWHIRGYLSEGRRWAAAAMKVDAAASPLVRAKVRHSEGVLARHQGDYAEASKLFADSLALFREAGDKNGVAEALNNLGILATNRAEYAAALELFDESLSLFRKLDDRRGTAMLLNNVAHIALIRGDYERAGRLLEESLQLHKASGEQDGISLALNNLGHVARNMGDNERAYSLYEESLRIKRKMGDKIGIASSLCGLGEVERVRGHHGESRTLLEESLSVYQEIGHKEGTVSALNNLGHLACDLADWNEAGACYSDSLRILRDLGDKWAIATCLIGLARLALARATPVHTARLVGMTQAMLEESGARLEPADQADYDGVSDAACLMLGDPAFGEAWRAGRSLSLDGARREVSAFAGSVATGV